MIQRSWMMIEPALLEHLQDHALPDQEARERDDERWHADERDDRALRGADQRADQRRRGRSRCRPFSWCPLPGNWSSATTSAPMPGDVADREVDLPEQQHEDDAVGEHRRAGHLDDDVAEVVGGEEVRRLEAEEDDDGDRRRRRSGGRRGCPTGGWSSARWGGRRRRRGSPRRATGVLADDSLRRSLTRAPRPSPGCRRPSSGRPR